MVRSGVSLQSNRGAAFLMLVYLSALVMLLLGGVSLQRTSVEVRASQVSGSMQQAFWLAETGIDKGLLAMRQDKPLSAQSDEELASVLGDEDYVKFARSSPRLVDGTYGPFTGPTGTYTIKVETTKIKILGPQGMQLTRAITSTGTVSGKSTSVTVTTVSDTLPLSGIFANGPVISAGFMTVMGSLHTAAGVPGSMYFGGDKTEIFGDVTIGMPDAENPYSTLIRHPQWRAAMDCCVSDGGIVADRDAFNAAIMGGAGVVVAAGSGSSDFPKNVITGSVAAVEMPKIAPVGMPAGLPESVTSLDSAVVPALDSLVVPEGETREFGGDGTTPIRMRVKSLALGRESKLIFKAPAEIYIDGSLTSDPGTLGGSYNSGFSAVGSAIYMGKDSVLVALDPDGKTLEEGVSLVVTDAGEGASAGTVVADYPWAFYGSVWAPQSNALLAASSALENYQDWMDLDSYLQDPNTIGGLRGVKNPYIVVDELQLGPSAAGGCAAFVVESDKAQQQNVNAPTNYPITSWRNSQAVN